MGNTEEMIAKGKGDEVQFTHGEWSSLPWGLQRIQEVSSLLTRVNKIIRKWGYVKMIYAKDLKL